MNKIYEEGKDGKKPDKQDSGGEIARERKEDIARRRELIKQIEVKEGKKKKQKKTGYC